MTRNFNAITLPPAKVRLIFVSKSSKPICKMYPMRFLTGIKVCVFLIFSVWGVCWAAPKNVIIFIGDGMGFEQVKAADFYAYGEPNRFCFESFPHKGQVKTASANSAITDSAAAGTAIATGHKVNNGVISRAIPGDSGPLTTLLEYAKGQGRRTGLVTTSYLADATPGAFGAHREKRSNYSGILNDYFGSSRPNVLFGGGQYIDANQAVSAGYTVVTDRQTMRGLDCTIVQYVCGRFGSGRLPYEFDGVGDLPHLSEMTGVALDILDEEPKGFFLMVEGGRIDHAGHSNDISRSVYEVMEFSNAVQAAINWSGGRSDTLIIVTADHETGGLTVLANNGQFEFPDVNWTTGGHTAANVPIYGWGENSSLISGTLDNTDIVAIADISAIACADVDNDSDVDFCDYVLFAPQWNYGNCRFPDFCSGSDLNFSGVVDTKDLGVLAANWLAK